MEKQKKTKTLVFTVNNISCSTVPTFQLELLGSELSEYQLEGGQHPDVIDRSKNLCKPYVSCLKVTTPK